LIGLSDIAKNTLFKRIFIYGLSDSISKVAPFIIIPIILKYLTPEDYGRIANFTAISNLFIPLILLNGHTYYTIEFHKISINERESLFWNVFNISCLLFLLTILLVSIFKQVFVEYFGLGLSWIYVAVFLSFLNGYILFFQAIQRMHEKVKLFAAIKIGNSILSALLVLLFVVGFNLSWEGRIYAFLLTSFVTLLVYFLFQKNIKLTYNHKIASGFLAFGLPLLPHSLAGWARGAVEKGMVTSITSIGDNGILAVAGISMAVIVIVTTSIFSAINPEILSLLAKIDQGNDDGEKKKIVIISITSIFAIAIVVCLFYPVNYLFFKYYLDESYMEGLRYVPFFLISSFFGAIYALFSLYIVNEKKSKLLSKITVTTIIIHLIITYFALSTYGVMGMVIATTFFSFFQSVVVAYFAHKLRPMPWLSIFKK
jgi:O-antigen/teichoic acid export membrane protein